MRVYVSGSFRFKNQMLDVVQQLDNRGIQSEMTEQVNPRGIVGCFEKIDRADVLYVVNPDGYVGKSVAADIGYAFARHKTVAALEPIEDPPLGDLPVVVCAPDEIDPKDSRLTPIPTVDRGRDHATAHCLCGGVRMRLKMPTLFSSHCHCESCRRAHAAAFVSWTAVAADHFQVTQGEDLVARHESSPGAFRCFCQRCGSSVYTYYTESHDVHGDAVGKIYVPTGLFDGELDKYPSNHVSFEEHVPWLRVADGLPRFRGNTEERM